MTLGEKIKALRKRKAMTQSSLSEGIVTRNMLSQIESGKASPSLDTLKLLSERLGISVSYLVSDDENEFFYEKEKRIGRIKELYRQFRFSDCVKECSLLSERDDEINLILANCYFNIAKYHVLYGSLVRGLSGFEKMLEHARETVYDTTAIRNVSMLYIALCKNIKSPLLEFEREKFEYILENTLDYEFYKYIIKDYDYKYKNENFKNHVLAKKKMAERDYRGALELLLRVENNKKDYNSHVFFAVYSDIEACYKQLLDFEGAYRYANKKISLMEGFKK